MNFEISKNIEHWGMFELQLQGPSEGNPFVEVELIGKFKHGDRIVNVTGFYDENGLYKLRFMPDEIGVWSYETISNSGMLNAIRGEFNCISPSKDNHGPVKVHNQHHFIYSDGTKYYPFGTTCYAWIHQGKELEKQTLDTLREAPFNKLRMCVFPKNYSNNNNEPPRYPFKGIAPKAWDFTSFNSDFFAHLEEEIKVLMDMGIEVDLILFHPYDKDRWGFDRMDSKTDEFYLRYVVARLASFRNVWWSMANEYDYMKEKKQEDWEKLFLVLEEADPYGHLRSIHNGDILYDHWKSYITHASIQLGVKVADFGRYRLLRDAYKKPVIYDEVGYEGNLEQRWGLLTPQEMVHRFWQGIISGTYVSHGETYKHQEDIIWWAKGGKLYGESPERIGFLKKIVEESNIGGMDFIDSWWILNAAGKKDEYYLYYFGLEKPTEWEFSLPAMGRSIPIGTKFKIDIIDTWNMTITPAEKLYEITDRQGNYSYVCSSNPKVDLPGREYMALRIRKVE
jgi:hypothetical protein